MPKQTEEYWRNSWFFAFGKYLKKKNSIFEVSGSQHYHIAISVSEIYILNFSTEKAKWNGATNKCSDDCMAVVLFAV